MSFRYFAYGSNLWPPQMRSRCASARVTVPARLDGWSLVYDKPSTDGSAKLNIRPDPQGVTHGVVYEIDEAERQALHAAEPRYTPIPVDVDRSRALTFTFEGKPFHGLPFDWYVATALAGARRHGLPDGGLDVTASPDPLAPGVRPAETVDLRLLQDIFSEAISAPGDRASSLPRDLARWVRDDHPGPHGQRSIWLQDTSAFVVIFTLPTKEISVFARPGVDSKPLIRWARRRLAGSSAL